MGAVVGPISENCQPSSDARSRDALPVVDLAGQPLTPRTFPHCGRPPDEDFADEETVVEDQPRETVLNLVR